MFPGGQEWISMAEHVPVVNKILDFVPRNINKKANNFFLWYWELNPRPYSCQASTLHTEL